MAIDRQELIARLESGSKDLSGLDLAGADLSRLDLRGVNLSRADLSAADLRWAILDGADLDSAVLRRADCRWALLRGAGLRNSDLVRTNLAWADLTGADLTGADLDGTNFESATLADVLLPLAPRHRARPPRPAGAAPGLGLPTVGGRALPRLSGAVVLSLLAGLAALLWLWGWLFRRSYYTDGFGLHVDGLTRLADTANLSVGLTRVLPLELVALLTVPIALIGVALVLAVVLLIPLLLVYLAERALSDVVRPSMRPVLVGGLFVAFTIVFILLLPPALSFARETSGQASPDSGPLHTVFGVFTGGGAWTWLGLLAASGLAGYAGWIGWRLFSHRLAGWQAPLSWRLRYPALDAALAGLRESRLVERDEPLDERERRIGGMALAALLLLLGFLLTGAGRVQAGDDMCDGGRLPRGQLYLNTMVAGADPRLQCQRLLVETDGEYYVFFPGQTVAAESAGGRRSAHVSAVQRSPDLLWVEAPGPSDCPTCASSAEVRQAARMRVVIDPGEIETEGQVVDRTGDLVNLDAPAGALASLRLSASTTYTLDGGPAGEAALETGAFVRAAGRPSADNAILEARLVEIQSRPAAAAPAPLAVELGDPSAIVISGSGFTPGNPVAIGLGPVGATGPQVPLVPQATVGSDGSFSVAVSYEPSMPTGAAWQVIARDGKTNQYSAGAWLQAPPPATATPRPSNTPLVVEEETPQPGEGTPDAQGTSTAAPGATNTALPTPQVPGGMAGEGDCSPDEFEPDWPRGYESEIYIGFGDGNAVGHSFCGRGPRPRNDVDLSYFYVKAWRWYRVSTSDLAPGVDTIMAVGDLSPSTRCEPAGCWNDDRAALTYESEIVFQAVEDGRAMITVDNRGGAYGTDATYQLSVAEFEPEPTSTPTVSTTPTASPTPTVTPTGLPYIDLYETNDRCSQAYVPLRVGQVYEAVIDTRTDEDWFKTEPLRPGRYRLEMQPPEDEDYDLTLHSFSNQSRNECPVLTHEGRNGGEGRAETIRFTIDPANDGAELGIRVYSRYPSIYYSEHHPYLLMLIAEEVGTALPTVTPTFTPSSTPTQTPLPPTPDSAVFPRPSITPSVTPGGLAAALPGRGS